MANPKVQKILNKVQGFFTNHGEKVAVGFGAAVFVLGAATAITKPTISITPDQVATNADAAQKNLNQPQDEASILETLANDGIKELNFADTVAKTESEKIDVNELRLKHKWVTLEPGAGLIRDQPVLIAINDVMAVAGRGGTTLFEDDDKGNRLPDDSTDDEKEEKAGGRGSKGGRGGMGMGMGHNRGASMMMHKHMMEHAGGARFHLRRGDSEISVRCPADTPLNDCIDAIGRVLDRLNSSGLGGSGTGSSTGSGTGTGTGSGTGTTR